MWKMNLLSIVSVESGKSWSAMKKKTPDEFINVQRETVCHLGKL